MVTLLGESEDDPTTLGPCSSDGESCSDLEPETTLSIETESHTEIPAEASSSSTSSTLNRANSNLSKL